MAVDESKDRALELALTQIERQFGKGSIMRLGDKELALNVPVIPTGSLSLDLALGVSYAIKLGVKTDDLLIAQPDTGEQALEICDLLVRSGAVDVIVIDSVPALTPKAEIEGEMGEPQMGLQARLMSQALRKLA